MLNQRELWRIKYIFLWVSANAIGFGAGVAFGEVIGHWIGEMAGWQLGVIAACIIFEMIVWVMRQSVLWNVQGFRAWRTFDSFIWFTSEMMGALFAEGLYEVTKSDWMTFGTLWGSLLGTGILIILWSIRTPKSTKWKRRFYIFVSGIMALVGGSILIAVIFIFSQETGRFFQKILGNLWGLGISGIITGAFIGLITGIAYLRMKIVRLYDPSTIENFER